MDTLRNCNYVFGVLCEVDDADVFQDEIFMITLYFFNKLLVVRTNSVQQKLEGIFRNHSGNQAFFNQLNRYLHSYISKIRKNVLQPFFAKQKYTDELSEKSYYIDKNLEKQIIDFLRLTCKNGNRQMQNYMKKQSNNTRSFNMVYMINDISKELLTHLHYPVAFDTYISCLRCILEFIQGPNRINQTILINNDFVPNVAVQILALGYHEDEVEYGNKLNQINNSLSKGMSIGMTKSRLGLPSISVGKSSLKQYGSAEVTMPTTNYMISLAKYWILLILNHLTDGYEPSDYIYYIYRREINPDIFRQNFAFQRYFFQRFNKDQYKTELFFSYYQNINSKKSPMIIEIGFELYFLIKKIEENIKLDYDERYTKSLIKLLPKWDKPQIKTQSNIVVETLFYFIDMAKAFLSFFRTSTDKISFNQIRKYAQNDTQIRATLNFFENQSAQIEIYKEGKLQKFWFPRLPYCVFQNSDVKDEFLQNVNRTDSKTKCNDLVRSSKIMLVILKIDYFLRSRLGSILGLIVGYIELWKKYLQLLAVIINVLIILSYNTDLGSRFKKPSIGDLDDTETLLTIRALGIVNLILAIIVVGVLMAQRIPYNIQKFRVRNQDTNKRLKESGQLVHEDLVRSTYIKFHAVYETTKLILFDVTLLYHMLYFIFIVLGVTYHPFFFSISLTYLIVSSPVLINVLKAVYEPRIQIILTLFLTIIVYYVFSIFSYMIFHSDYNDSLENACYSLWSCLFITIDQSYKNDGAIGGFLPIPFTAEESEIKVEWGRFFYDYIFNLVIAILLTEILSGIIIDKFSELRESNEEKRKDEMSECFICGQTREELEKKLGYNGFRYHTIFQHNMWDYLFFIGYLKNKKNSYVNDYMESERYVLEKLEDDENNWMPCYA